MDHANVNGADLAYEVVGSGDALLLIHGALIADAMRPLATARALEGFQRILYHRRGYGASARVAGPAAATVQVQADDAVALLDHLDIDRAHVVGHSAGGRLALEVAVRHPARVASLALLEPGLLATARWAAFGELVTPPLEAYQAGDVEAAVNHFLSLVGDGHFRDAVERAVPGGLVQAVIDAPTMFEAEFPAMAMNAMFGPEQAAAIACPVLAVLGAASGPLFVEGDAALRTWVPQCHTARIAGAGHLLQMEQPSAVAEAIASFCGDESGRPRTSLHTAVSPAGRDPAR